MRAGSPWNATRSGASSSQRWRARSSGKSSRSAASIDGDVVRVARQHRPPERPDAAAEERPDIGRDEARVCERLLYAGLYGPPLGGCCHNRKHSCRLGRTRAAPRRARAIDSPRPAQVLVRIGRAQRSRLLDVEPDRDVAVQRVVRRGLVGDEVEVLAAPGELRHDLGRVPEQPDRQRAPLCRPPRARARARRRATRSPRRGSASRAAARSARGRPRRRGSPRRPASPRAAARRPSRRARR